MINRQQSVREVVSPIVRYGGKARAAPVVWQALGDPQCYIDPFAGSLAVPLRAPQPLRKVVVNDVDDLLVNFWRALQCEPEGVAYWADYPTSHTDLIARREWLRQQWPAVRQAMKLNPTWYDCRIAGWWAWAVSNSIDLLRIEYPSDDSHQWYNHVTNSITISGSLIDDDGSELAPLVAADVAAILNGSIATSINHQQPPAAGYTSGSQPPAAGNDVVVPTGTGGIANDKLFPDDYAPLTSERLAPWFSELARKIQRWIILCKDWKDVVGSRSITSTTATQPGTTCGIFLDPPYNRESIERKTLYSAEDFDVANHVFEWLVAHDDRYGCSPWENPQLRIVLCGYSNDYRASELPGARIVPWRRGGGMERAGAAGSYDDARRQEILVLSPACLPVVGEYAPDGAPPATTAAQPPATPANHQQPQLPFF